MQTSGQDTMSTKQLKIANILIWSGVGLLALSIVLGMPTFYPYLDTLLQTANIPLAPPIAPTLAATGGDGQSMLSSEDPTEGHGYVLAASDADVSVGPDPTDPPVATPEETAEPTTTPTPLPTVTPLPPTPIPSVGTSPQQIQIPSINLDAPIIPTEWEVETTDAGPQVVWIVPDWRAVGWHYTSAPLGIPGNTVLNGHNTTKGEVFRDLYKTQTGDQIFVGGEDGNTYEYLIEDVYILAEAGQPMEVRMENAKYIQPTTDERLTLVTCHPYGSTRYRLIVIAHPASVLTEEASQQLRKINEQ